MAKRKSTATVDTKTVNLILWIMSLATAVLSLVGLVCNFITVQGKESVWGHVSKSHWNLGEWFENINDMASVDKIAAWQFARVMLIVTLLLLLAMAVLLVLKIYFKQPAMKWSTVGVGIAVAVGALIFMITTFVGCGALSFKTGVSTFTFIPNFGVFLFGLGAVASAVLAEIVLWRK